MKLKTIAPLVTAVLVPVLIFAIGELALTAAGSGHSASVVRPCKIEGSAAYCDNQDFTSVVFPAGVTRPPSPFAFAAAKDRNTYRIFVLGESAAYGDPDPAYSFSRYLAIMLRHRFPQRRFEVINASITAVNSHVLLRMAKDLAAYQPDLFIVYAGNNEVIGPYGPGTTLSSQMPGLTVVRATLALRATRWGQLLARLTQKPRQFKGMEMFLDQQVPASSPDLPRVYDYLAANLTDLVRVANQAHADVILSTVATNLGDSAPFHSAHKPGLTESALASWEARFNAGKEKQTAGDYQGAVQEYLAAEAVDAQFAELQFRIASCSLRLGDVPNSKTRFEAARELDTLRFRADRGVNQAIMRAASLAPHATLVDAAAAISSASPDGIPGHELFFDHVHLRPRGNYLVAAAMFEQVERMVIKKMGSDSATAAPLTAGLLSSEVLSEDQCDRRLALTDYDMTRLAREMQRRFQRPPFTGQFNNVEQIERLQQEEREHTVPLDASLAVYEWAIMNSPDDCLLRQNLGLLLYGINRPAALAQLRLSRPYHDTALYMPDGTRIE